MKRRITLSTLAAALTGTALLVTGIALAADPPTPVVPAFPTGPSGPVTPRPTRQVTIHNSPAYQTILSNVEESRQYLEYVNGLVNAATTPQEREHAEKLHAKALVRLADWEARLERERKTLEEPPDATVAARVIATAEARSAEHYRKVAEGDAQYKARVREIGIATESGFIIERKGKEVSEINYKRGYREPGNSWVMTHDGLGWAMAIGTGRLDGPGNRGALLMDTDEPMGTLYAGPEGTGRLTIVGERGLVLELRGDTGSTVYFDLTTRTYQRVTP